MPVHWAHHHFGMYRHNFGLAVPWWDYLFGTYRRDEWDNSDVQRPERNGRWWAIRWI